MVTGSRLHKTVVFALNFISGRADRLFELQNKNQGDEKLRIRVRQCLTEVRRATNREGLVARRQGEEISIYPKPPVPEKFTAEQLRSQDALACVGLAWRLLGATEKAEWDRYGALFEKHYPRQSTCRLTGQLVYCGAATRRLMLAMDPPTEAPLMAAPPPPPASVELLPMTGAGETAARTFRLRLVHGGATEGMVVVGRLGPATSGPARKPDRRHSTLICGFHPNSARPLPPSGEIVTFSDARTAIEPGARFGLWLATMRLSDGIASPERFFDLIRSRQAS